MEDSEAVQGNENTENEIPAKKQRNETTEEPSRGAKAGAESKTDDHRWSRLKLFEKVMQKSMEKFIEHASFNRFASNFRPLYKKNPQRMENIHKQFIEELRRAIQDDISKLMEEGQLESKLNELDKLESAAKKKPNPTWRPSGIPEQDFCSFLMPYYQKQEAYLRLELKKIQAENADLAQKVQAGRGSVAQTEQRISAAVDKWKASVTEFEKQASSLGPVDVFDV